jgi:hypothetical protein
MKKSALPAALLLLGVALSGCPVYDANDDGCYSDYDCRVGDVCDGQSGACVPSSNACQRPSDCGTNETCSKSGTCVSGDCHFSSVGCVHGYECSSDSGAWECVTTSDAGGAGATGGAGGVDGSEPSGMAGAGAVSGVAGQANEATGGSGEPAAGGVGGG